MILREFIYFNKKQNEMQPDNRYDPGRDISILDKNDLRKSPKLTLKIINDIRKAGEIREKEVKEELGLVRKMYATPPPQAA